MPNVRSLAGREPARVASTPRGVRARRPGGADRAALAASSVRGPGSIGRSDTGQDVGYPEAIVAIAADGDRPRKVVRIVTMRDGSFSIAAPYHYARTGLLAKMEAPPILSQPGAGWSTPIDPAHVDVRVKLTYHASGFVQFSSAEGNRIRSGRGAFSVPNGMGLHSHPLTDPIESGPSCGLNAFHLTDFQPLDGKEKAPVILFEEKHIFETGRSPDRDERLYYITSIFVFPSIERREAIYADGGWVLRRPYAPSRPEWPAEFRVLDLGTSLWFLGVIVERRNMVPGDEDSTARYTIGGPRDLGSRRWLAGWFPNDPDGDVTPRSPLAWPPAPPGSGT